MNGDPIAFCSVTQEFVILSITEAKIAAGMMLAQDMLHMYHLLESLELKVVLSMVLEIDNSGAVAIDIDNKWSVKSRKQHVHVTTSCMN